MVTSRSGRHPAAPESFGFPGEIIEAVVPAPERFRTSQSKFQNGRAQGHLGMW